MVNQDKESGSVKNSLRLPVRKMQAFYRKNENPSKQVMAMEKKKEKQEEDERREELIASTPSLQPNFKAKGGITQTQLSKFQVLFRNLSPISTLFFSLMPIYVQFCIPSNVHGGDKVTIFVIYLCFFTWVIFI